MESKHPELEKLLEDGFVLKANLDNGNELYSDGNYNVTYNPRNDTIFQRTKLKCHKWKLYDAVVRNKKWGH